MKTCDNCSHQIVCLIFKAVEEIMVNSFEIKQSEKNQVYEALSGICVSYLPAS